MTAEVTLDLEDGDAVAVVNMHSLTLAAALWSRPHRRLSVVADCCLTCFFFDLSLFLIIVSWTTGTILPCPPLYK